MVTSKRWRDVVDALDIEHAAPLATLPLYGSKAFSPLTRCDDIHHGPLPSHSSAYCECCSKHARDGRPEMTRNPFYDVSSLAARNEREAARQAKLDAQADPEAEPTTGPAKFRPKQRSTGRRQLATA